MLVVLLLMGFVTLGNGDYFDAGNNENECPEGFVRITSPEDCATAMVDLCSSGCDDRTTETGDDGDHNPKGCHRSKNSNIWRFNTHAVGGPRDAKHLICKRSAPCGLPCVDGGSWESTCVSPIASGKSCDFTANSGYWCDNAGTRKCTTGELDFTPTCTGCPNLKDDFATCTECSDANTCTNMTCYPNHFDLNKKWNDGCEEVKVEKLAEDKVCSDGSLVIRTCHECSLALAAVPTLGAVGLKSDFTWKGSTDNIPAGCSTKIYHDHDEAKSADDRRDFSEGRPHFNTETDGVGEGKWNLAPICKKQADVEFKCDGMTKEQCKSCADLTDDNRGPCDDYCNRLIECGAHGTYDASGKTCTCDEGWTGDRCETAPCGLPCVDGGSWESVCDSSIASGKSYDFTANSGYWCDNAGTRKCTAGLLDFTPTCSGCPNLNDYFATCTECSDANTCTTLTCYPNHFDLNKNKNDGCEEVVCGEGEISSSCVCEDDLRNAGWCQLGVYFGLCREGPITSECFCDGMKRGGGACYESGKVYIAKCKDGAGHGKNYCSQWCNTRGVWGCGVVSHGEYKCDCTGCNNCRGRR